MTISSHSDTFKELLAKYYPYTAEDTPLQVSKAKAWEHFLKLGLPSTESEVYRYVHLRKLFSNSYALSHPVHILPEQIASHIIPECAGSCLIFVNGHYQPHLSRFKALPKNIYVSSLKDALRPYGTFINSQWAKLSKESDSFAILNAALHRDGIFFYIPPRSQLDTPLQILNVIDCQETQMLIFPRIHLFVGAHSQVSMVSSSIRLSGENYCLNQFVEVSIEEGAQLIYNQIEDAHTSNAWHFDAFRANLKRDSSLKTILINTGAATVRHDYHISLSGENSSARLNGICMLSENREAHVNILMDHQAPHCQSMQLFKSVLADSARSSFEGKILVQQLAQKTEAFQLNNNLLISDNAHADSKPNLEIFADDVKASHGATIGQLDPEQLFYMMTRGFSEHNAKNLLIHSFCKEIIDQVTIPSLMDAAVTCIKKYDRLQ